MEMTPSEQRRLDRMERLFARYPDRLCWAELAIAGVYGLRTEARLYGPRVLRQIARKGSTCAQAAARDGTCYCGAMGTASKMIDTREGE